jgi:hypothetical protein
MHSRSAAQSAVGGGAPRRDALAARAIKIMRRPAVEGPSRGSSAPRAPALHDCARILHQPHARPPTALPAHLHASVAGA